MCFLGPKRGRREGGGRNQTGASQPTLGHVHRQTPIDLLSSSLDYDNSPKVDNGGRGRVSLQPFSLYPAAFFYAGGWPPRGCQGFLHATSMQRRHVTPKANPYANAMPTLASQFLSLFFFVSPPKVPGNLQLRVKQLCRMSDFIPSKPRGDYSHETMWEKVCSDFFILFPHFLDKNTHFSPTYFPQGFKSKTVFGGSAAT